MTEAGGERIENNSGYPTTPKMAAKIRCYRDENGFNRVKVIEGHQNVGAFLEQDVQSSARCVDEYLVSLEAVADGRETSWEGTGNAHTVTIESSGVTIENVWDEGRGVATLTFDEFRQCLLSWLDCISNR